MHSSHTGFQPLLALAASAFAVVSAHPGSPVLFQLLGPNHRIGYLAWSASCCLMILLAIRDHRGRDCRFTPTGWITWYRSIVCLAAISLFIQMLISKNLMAAREIAATATLFSVSFLRPRQIRELLNHAIVVTCMFQVISMIALLIFVASGISIEPWSVDGLRWISPANPAYGRGDFDYWAMPAYLTVVPVDDPPSEIALGYSAQRFPLLYAEATFVWAVALPFCFMAVLDQGLGKWRPFVALSALASMLMCPGVWGLAVAAIAIIVGLVTIWLRRGLLYFVVVGALGLASTLSIWLEPALVALGGNKADQYYFLSEQVDLNAITSLWGRHGSESSDTHERSYGQLFALQRFGIAGCLGSVVFAVFSVVRIFWTLRFRVPCSPISADFALALAALASILMALKQTTAMPLWLGIFVAALCHGAKAAGKSSRALPQIRWARGGLSSPQHGSKVRCQSREYAPNG
jgi:hypothetical protein